MIFNFIIKAFYLFFVYLNNRLKNFKIILIFSGSIY